MQRCRIIFNAAVVAALVAQHYVQGDEASPATTILNQLETVTAGTLRAAADAAASGIEAPKSLVNELRARGSALSTPLHAEPGGRATPLLDVAISDLERIQQYIQETSGSALKPFTLPRYAPQLQLLQSLLTSDTDSTTTDCEQPRTQRRMPLLNVGHPWDQSKPLRSYTVHPGQGDSPLIPITAFVPATPSVLTKTLITPITPWTPTTDQYEKKMPPLPSLLVPSPDAPLSPSATTVTTIVMPTTDTITTTTTVATVTTATTITPTTTTTTTTTTVTTPTASQKNAYQVVTISSNSLQPALSSPPIIGSTTFDEPTFLRYTIHRGVFIGDTTLGDTIQGNILFGDTALTDDGSSHDDSINLNNNTQQNATADSGEDASDNEVLVGGTGVTDNASPSESHAMLGNPAKQETPLLGGAPTFTMGASDSSVALPKPTILPSPPPVTKGTRLPSVPSKASSFLAPTKGASRARPVLTTSELPLFDSDGGKTSLVMTEDSSTNAFPSDVTTDRNGARLFVIPGTITRDISDFDQRVAQNNILYQASDADALDGFATDYIAPLHRNADESGTFLPATTTLSDVSQELEYYVDEQQSWRGPQGALRGLQEAEGSPSEELTFTEGALFPLDLREEILQLAKFQPHLTGLFKHWDNPFARSNLLVLKILLNEIKRTGTLRGSDRLMRLYEPFKSFGQPLGLRLGIADAYLTFLDKMTQQ